jgi:undecaprenyl-diphosphatase
MNILNAILLGLVQGVAEFLPISSSGHLALVENILGAQAVAEMDSSALFNILLHLATLVAVIIAYWADVKAMAVEGVAMVKGLGKGQSLSEGNIPARRLIVMIVVATVPLFVIVPFNDAIEKLNAMPWFIGLALIVTGTLLYIADRMPKGTKTEKNMTLVDALVIGLAQAVATLPGLSRSGTTITAGISRGLNREFAVRFSFLMSLLSVLGAVVLKVISALGEPVDGSLIPAYLIGMVVAGVTGYLSIRLLQKLVVDKGRFGGFAYYCWGVGALSVILSLVLK